MMHKKWWGGFPTGLLILALVALAILSGGGVASAHAKLASSTPADGSTLAAAPAQVILNFDEDLAIDGPTASVTGAGNTAVDKQDAAVDKANRRQMTLSLGTLGPGTYTVHWHAVTADDNGVTEGTTTFTVQAAGTTGGAAPVTTAPVATATAGAAPGGTMTNGTAAAAANTLPATGHPDAGALGLLLAAAGLLGLGWRLRRRGPASANR